MDRGEYESSLNLVDGIVIESKNESIESYHTYFDELKEFSEKAIKNRIGEIIADRLHDECEHGDDEDILESYIPNTSHNAICKTSNKERIHGNPSKCLRIWGCEYIRSNKCCIPEDVRIIHSDTHRDETDWILENSIFEESILPRDDTYSLLYELGDRTEFPLIKIKEVESLVVRESIAVRDDHKVDMNHPEYLLSGESGPIADVEVREENDEQVVSFLWELVDAEKDTVHFDDIRILDILHPRDILLAIIKEYQVFEAVVVKQIVIILLEEALELSDDIFKEDILSGIISEEHLDNVEEFIFPDRRVDKSLNIIRNHFLYVYWITFLKCTLFLNILQKTRGFILQNTEKSYTHHQI